ncbi:MAG: CopG family ribbon-helix-helix protein [Promethearchaeota archaeon]
MPIISISINENLKKFLNKLISKNQYENRSKIIRDALLRLMSTMENTNSLSEGYGELIPITKKITGNMMMVFDNDINVHKKLNKIELEFKDQIVSKTQNFSSKESLIFMTFEGQIKDFQKLVVEINSINELKNFRYLIVN